MGKSIFIVPSFILFSSLISGIAHADGMSEKGGKNIAKFLDKTFYYEDSNSKEYFNSYEDQFSAIIKSAINPSSNHIGSNSSAVAALKNIASLFDSGGMLLKNVVYRSDTGYIRVTFSSKDDSYVVKGTYGTSFDDVLVNSNYADKKKLIDLKIMYLPVKGGKYMYYHIFNSTRKASDNQKMIGVETEPGGEACKYCHQLAQVSGEQSGLFFQRYQYNQKSFPLHSSFLTHQMPGIFKDSNYIKMDKKPDWAPAGLSDTDTRYKITMIKNIESAIQVRNLILESPELLETFSMDNKRSYCLAFDLPGINTVGLDYVCTDYPKKMLYVKLNRQGDNKLVEFSHPFYKKHDNGEISYNGAPDSNIGK